MASSGRCSAREIERSLKGNAAGNMGYLWKGPFVQSSRLPSKRRKDGSAKQALWAIDLNILLTKFFFPSPWSIIGRPCINPMQHASLNNITCTAVPRERVQGTKPVHVLLVQRTHWTCLQYSAPNRETPHTFVQPLQVQSCFPPILISQ